MVDSGSSPDGNPGIYFALAPVADFVDESSKASFRVAAEVGFDVISLDVVFTHELTVKMLDGEVDVDGRADYRVDVADDPSCWT